MTSSPPPPPSMPPMTPPTQEQKRRHYFIGLGVGLIPLIIFLVSFGLLYSTISVSLTGILIAAFLYIIELIVTIIVLVNNRLHFAGYGLLTAFLVNPVIAAVDYTILPNLIQPH